MTSADLLKQQFRVLMDDLLANKIGCHEANARVIQLGNESRDLDVKERLVDQAFEAIIHFCSDEDIRSVNEEYATRQIAQLKRLRDCIVEQLESGS
jgi:hypothetical protein